MNHMVLFDFNKNVDTSSWAVVDDGVMGGKSAGEFKLNNEGNAVFSGTVSLANNGGFSSLRCRLQETALKQYSKFSIRLKGDGKRYQFRIKSSAQNYYSYIAYFDTTSEWQVIEIPFEELSPWFRGRKLNQANFPGDYVEEMGFLIGNKKAERFKLEIDKIEVL